jgi:hypothetical protein
MMNTDDPQRSYVLLLIWVTRFSPLLPDNTPGGITAELAKNWPQNAVARRGL